LGESLSITKSFPVEVFGYGCVEQSQDWDGYQCNDVINGYWVKSHSGHAWLAFPGPFPDEPNVRPTGAGWVGVLVTIS